MNDRTARCYMTLFLMLTCAVLAALFTACREINNGPVCEISCDSTVPFTITIGIYMRDCTADQDAGKATPIDALNPWVSTDPETVDKVVKAATPGGAASDIVDTLTEIETTEPEE